MAESIRKFVMVGVDKLGLIIDFPFDLEVATSSDSHPY